MIRNRIARLVDKNVIDLKNVGNAPAIIAKVVSPKEKPGLPGNKLEMATRLTGMVRLNKKRPIIPTTANCGPKNNRSADSAKPLTVTFIQPK